MGCASKTSYDLQDNKRTALGFANEKVSKVSFYSEALETEKSYYVYLPEDYKKNVRTRYPVVYILRGHEREWVNPNEDQSREESTVIEIYEKLLNENKIGPMILVFPSMASSDNTINGLGVNFVNPPEGIKGVGTGKFEDYFIVDLIEHIDTNYRTLATKYGRAIDGFSLGGFTSVSIALKHPDLFCSVGAFDGTFLYYDNLIDSYDDTVFYNSLLNHAFGTPRDREFAVLNNPANLIKDGDIHKLSTLAFHIQSAPKTQEPRANYHRTKHLLEIMNEKGLTNSFSTGVLENSRHNWISADRHMELTLPLHFREFNENK